MRQDYKCILYTGYGNATQNTKIISAKSAHEAATLFVNGFGGEIYSIREERPYTDEIGIQWQVWSAGNSLSGQRVYIYK